MYKIEFIAKENLNSILPLLEVLNPEISLDVIAQRLSEIKKSEYKCVGVYFDDRLIAISGIWILNKIYAGKHIEPDNVIVHPDFRRKGVGEMMMDWIHQYAIENGCMTSELNARITNESGNTFWKNQGYEIAGYHYIKKLADHHANKNEINSCLSNH